METRAHHVLIGLFTVLAVGGALLFALWLGKSSMDREYNYYEISFNRAVSGLSNGSASAGAASCCIRDEVLVHCRITVGIQPITICVVISGLTGLTTVFNVTIDTTGLTNGRAGADSAGRRCTLVTLVRGAVAVVVDSIAGQVPTLGVQGVA